MDASIMTHLGLSEAQLQARAATCTAQEISQQPAMWRATRELIEQQAPSLDAFLRPLLAKKALRIILSGAGSSAYIGQCLQPELFQRLGRRVAAIATTDLVAGPLQCLQPEVPTLLVSFARSGSSPESVAAVQLAERYVKDCSQLVITCNERGALFRHCAHAANCFALLLPDATNDRGFAMTSSFTSMLYAGLAALAPACRAADIVTHFGQAGAAVLDTLSPQLRLLATRPFTRVAYLGSRSLTGLASEAALKLLELTDGSVVSLATSPLGFRHGPKTFINSDTLVVVFVSNDPLTRRYDLDLLRELRQDGFAGQVLALSGQGGDDLGAADAFVIPGMSSADDCELWFPYVLCAQIYAFYRSLELGKSPDNPSASGTVNRVVKGVTIHAS